MELTTPDPVRERILEYLKEAFENVTDLGREEGLTWEAVIRQPITDEDRKLKNVISIIEGRETTLPKASMVEDKMLDVSFEFEFKAYAGEQPNTFLNFVLADINQTLSAHGQCGGLCLHVRVTGSDQDIEAGDDPRVGGIVFATIHYRHKDGDPCRLIGE